MPEKLQVALQRLSSNYVFSTIEHTILEKGFEKQNTSSAQQTLPNVSIYYKQQPTTPKWKDFFKPHVDLSEKIIKAKQSASESFVMLIKEGDNLYAVTGGFGFHVVQDFIEDGFGLEVISRLVNPNDRVLLSSRDKSMVGGLAGSSKYFRRTTNIFQGESFGKIFQELRTKIDNKKVAEAFSIDPKLFDKEVQCLAKSSFKIGKSISSEQIFNIIKGCEQLLGQPRTVNLNDIRRLNPKKDAALIEQLDEALIQQLWQRYNTQEDSFDFDVCHDETEKYITANNYAVFRGNGTTNIVDSNHRFDTLSSIDQVFEKLRVLRKPPNDIDRFKKAMQTLVITSFNEDSTECTKGRLLDHLFGDVTYQGQKYFFTKGWFQLSADFTVSLDKSCSEILAQHQTELLSEIWLNGASSENEYLQQYIGQPKTIVLDRVIPENIEVCDVLIWDDESLYLCHVKKGFSNSTRELCSQIAISANRLVRDRSTDYEFARKLYSELKQKIGGEPYFDTIGRQTETIDETSFLELFKKRLVFVFSVIDDAKEQRDIRSVREFGSSIAKFSLQELYKELRGLDVGFRACQISTTPKLPPQSRATTSP
jgi:uncharacterized protein (TIGR04141 family)